MPTQKNNKPYKVLVAPLDWGLGHATRCIPLIQSLLEDGCEVWLAGSGPSGKLLTAEFPDLPYREIPSHPVQYARSRGRFLLTMLGQLPRLLRQVKEEKYWLEQFLEQHPMDVILSDNRYGLHHPSTTNILITHQLGPRLGVSNGADRILARVHKRLMNNFNACWVPDHPFHPNLSGLLGHPTWTAPIPVHYIGPLTRFKPATNPIIPGKITIVLSGPEPQRNLLEKKCLQELRSWTGPITMVRGLPQNTQPIAAPAHWTVFDHLPTPLLQQEMEEAERIIARCGYSTLMDLSVLKKRSILIPTPGQPEQEYLAGWIGAQGLAYCIAQTDDLLLALKQEEQAPRSFNLHIEDRNAGTGLIPALHLMRSLRP